MEPDAVCGSGGSSVWRYMAALPHLSLIECKLNLVLSLGGKTETEGGEGRRRRRTTIYLEAISAKENHIRRAFRWSPPPPGGPSTRRNTASVSSQRRIKKNTNKNTNINSIMVNTVVSPAASGGEREKHGKLPELQTPS